MAPSITETESVSQPELKPVDSIPPKPADTHEEHQYLDLIREILDTGEHRPDRYQIPSNCT
jgi:thymidylate synthase